MTITITLLLTSDGHHWRPVQTCPLEDLPSPLPVVATETCTVDKQAVCILLECCLVVVILNIP